MLHTELWSQCPHRNVFSGCLDRLSGKSGCEKRTMCE